MMLPYIFLCENYERGKVMRKIFLAVAVTMLIASLSACGGSSSDYNGYSDTYNSDAEYRKNVSDIADTWGMSEREVDASINALTGGKWEYS